MMQSKEFHCYLNRVTVQLVSEKLPEYKITDVIDAKEIASNYLRKYDRECFITLLLGGTNKVMAINEVAVGTLTNALVHPREVFKEAYRLSATYIVCIHNHPSNNTTPSKADIEFTNQITKTGILHGIKIVDHIISGYDNFYSFYEQKKTWLEENI